MQEKREITFKPEKKAFVYYKFGIGLFVSIIVLIFFLFGFLLIQFNLLYLFIGFGILLFLNILNFAYLSVRYKKEIYIVKGDRFIAKQGGFFSDHETELIIKNITQVWMNKPYVENKIYETANILIKAAGSSNTEIYFSSIKKPDELYEKIWNIMEKNGFVLSKKRLIQKEYPNSLAIIFEIIKRIFGGVFSFLLVLIFAGPPLIGLLKINILYILPIIFIISIVFTIKILLRYLDLKKRVYYLYEDQIEYYEGFLTKNYSFIPIENLSDSEITQTFIDKIFNLYDIKISCQGSGNEIYFTNIENGKLFKKNLDELITKTPTLIQSKTNIKNEKILGENKKINLVLNEEKKNKKIDNKLGDDFTFITKMDAKRTFLPPIIFFILFILSLVFVLFFISIIGRVDLIKLLIGVLVGSFFIGFWIIFAYIIVFIKNIISVFCTTYKINKNSIEYDFNFLNTKNYEFTLDKVTRIIIKENFIDKLFNTIKIEFNSIGSSENITFTNIKKDKNLIDGLLNKFEFLEKDIIKEYKAKFMFKNMIYANLFLFGFIFIMIFIIIALSIFLNSIIAGVLFIIMILIIVFYVYRTFYYKTARLRIYENFVSYTRGLFFMETHYAKFNYIKDIQTIKYPFSKNTGQIIFDIAGEIMVQTNNNQKAALSNSFKMNYLEEVFYVHDYIDQKLFYKNTNEKKSDEIKLFKNSILKSKPKYSNHVFLASVISIIIFPFLVFLPITLFILILIIKKITFEIQDERITKYSGVIYKKKKTILFTRIDHIIKKEGFLNKMFNNGNVNIHTTGSSMLEMNVFAIKDYNDFYNIVKEKY
jgi:uncharacterized membrane protein YdbT with pleckstrin-like domain